MTRWRRGELVVVALCLVVVVVVVLATLAGSPGSAATPEGVRAPVEPDQATVAVPDAPAASQDPGQPIGAQTFRRIAQAQTSTVVSIQTEARRQTSDLREFFGRAPFGQFFDLPRPRDEILEGAGSGVVIDPAGLILTNHHVVEGATKIQVGFFAAASSRRSDEGRLYPAKVLGRDPLTDTALLQLTEKPSAALTAARLGTSSTLAPGDWVVAIGNPFNLQHTVTVGVISALGRPFQPVEGRVQEVLQTDAAINPGNSGGPLLNLQGEVVGINSAILSGRRSGGNLGIGFAVPIDAVKALLPQLREGRVVRGWLGVQISPLTDEAARALGVDGGTGVVVASVQADSPAARAGFQPGDVIVDFAGKAVRSPAELSQAVTAAKPGTTAAVRVVRDRTALDLSVQIEELRVAGAGDEGDPEGTSALGLTLSGVPAAIASRAGREVGAMVTDVQPGGVAARVGVRRGDVILEVNQHPVSGVAATLAALREVKAGRPAFLLIWREGRQLFLTLPAR